MRTLLEGDDGSRPSCSRCALACFSLSLPPCLGAVPRFMNPSRVPPPPGAARISALFGWRPPLPPPPLRCRTRASFSSRAPFRPFWCGKAEKNEASRVESQRGGVRSTTAASRLWRRSSVACCCCCRAAQHLANVCFLVRTFPARPLLSRRPGSLFLSAAFSCLGALLLVPGNCALVLFSPRGRKSEPRRGSSPGPPISL